MLEVSHLFKTYGKGSLSFLALNDLSIRFPDKGLVVILGTSGSGKSTLLNILDGLDKADSGQVLVDGRDITSFSNDGLAQYRCGYLGVIFQEANLIDTMSVFDNLSLALRLEDKKTDVNEMEDILSSIGLSNIGYRKPSELSGGQLQRVSIARALIKNPKIILADEPTGALDRASAEGVFEILKNIALDKLVIVVTHDSYLAYKYSDRVIELQDGEIVSDSVSVSSNTAIKEIGNELIEVSCGGVLSKKHFDKRIDKDNDYYIGLSSDKEKIHLAFASSYNENETLDNKFVSYKEEKNNVIQEDKYVTKETKLKNKEALFLTKSNIKKTKGKFFLLTIINAICFALIIFSFSFSNISFSSITVSGAFTASSCSFVNVSRVIKNDDSYISYPFDETNEKNFSSVYEGEYYQHSKDKFSPIYANKETSKDSLIESISLGEFDFDYFTGFLEVNNKIEDLDFIGSTSLDSYSDIVISDIAASSLSKYGFLGIDKSGVQGIYSFTNYEELIGYQVKSYQTIPFILLKEYIKPII